MSADGADLLTEFDRISLEVDHDTESEDETFMLLRTTHDEEYDDESTEVTQHHNRSVTVAHEQPNHVAHVGVPPTLPDLDKHVLCTVGNASEEDVSGIPRQPIAQFQLLVGDHRHQVSVLLDTGASFDLIPDT